MTMFPTPEILDRPVLEATKTAVVVVDMVNHQVTPGKWLMAHLAERGIDLSYIEERVRDLVIPSTQRLLDTARSNGGRVAYVRVGTLSADYADGLPAYRKLYPIWEAYDGSYACDVIEALAPQPGDINLIKTGSGGFTTSALDRHLRNLGVEHVVYTGVITNACVLLTMGGGSDLGYYGYLASECTATFSQRLQDISEEIIGAQLGEVLSTDELIRRLGGIS